MARLLTPPLGASLLTGLAVAGVMYGVGYLVSDYGTDWYRSLARPAHLSPELEKAIPLIWAGLYLLAGLGLGFVLYAERSLPFKLLALGLLTAKFALNAKYGHTFTVERDLNGALTVAAGLTGTVALFLLMAAAYRAWLPVVCFVPYLGWCVYATLLTSELATLNPAAPPAAAVVAG